MLRNKWGAKALALAAACALTLTACGGGGSKKSESTSSDAPAKSEVIKGGTIKAAVAYESNNYDPSSTSSALALGANWHVVEGLYELDMTDFKPYKALAKTDDPVKVDDTTYEVQLRDGAKFSDGTAVTADDVVESFKRAMADGNIYLPMLSFIKEVTKKDDTTVTIKLNYAFTLVKPRLALVKIIPASSTADQNKAQPVGSGPWKYKEINTQHIVFEPNTNYNGDRPAAADSMEWQILKDDTARTTAMQQKTVGVMENVPADAAEMLAGAGAVVKDVQGFNLPFLLFNTKKAPFDKAEVRQAFLYAIDTEKLIQNAMSGKASAATSFLPESHPNYHKAKNVYTYNKDKAKELLKNAGVAEGTKVTLLTTDHPWIAALAPQVQNNLKDLGLDVELKSMASASLYKDNLDQDNPTFDVALAPGDPSVFGNDPDLLMSWWYGDNVWTKKRTGWNGSEGYKKLHEYMDEAVKATGDKQQEAWNKAFDVISEEVPLYPLFHRQVTTAYYEDMISGYTPVSTTGLDFVGAGAGSASK